MVYTVDWAACREREQREIALALWAEARRLEEMGNKATTGIDRYEQPEEWNRAFARQSAWFGAVTALERMAWQVLGRSFGAAPAIVRATSLMPIHPGDEPRRAYGRAYVHVARGYPHFPLLELPAGENLWLGDVVRMGPDGCVYRWRGTDALDSSRPIHGVVAAVRTM